MPISTTQTLQQCQFGTGDTLLNLLQGALNAIGLIGTKLDKIKTLAPAYKLLQQQV